MWDLKSDISDDQNVPEIDKENVPEEKSAPVIAPAFQYQEPSWGGVPDPDRVYTLEILKNGTIVDTFKLVGKSYFTVGRLPICDVPFEHPSLSRYHAILQFKTNPSPEKPVGFY